MRQEPDLNDEIDFAELRKEPSRLFGYTYIYVLLALVALGVFYVWNLNAIGRNALRPYIPTDSSAFVKDIPFQSPAVLPPLDITKAANPTESLVARGRELYRANCSSCHGEQGMGDGPAGAVLNPRPRNFHTAGGWTNGPKISQIFKTLTEGIVRNGMAAYTYLPPTERIALIHYVRTFLPAPPADTQEELLALESTYQLSKGSSIPGQIPVRKALERFLAERSSTAQAVEKLAPRVMQRSNAPGATLFREMTRDPERALAVLANGKTVTASVQQFRKAVSANPLALGFYAKAARMNDAEWQALHEYCSSLRTTLVR